MTVNYFGRKLWIGEWSVWAPGSESACRIIYKSLL